MILTGRPPFFVCGESMADNSMRLNLIMGMVDKITGPVKKVTSQTGRMAEQIKGTQNELKRLGSTTKDIEHLKALRDRSSQTASALDQAQARVKALAREMNATTAPTKKMTQAFEKAKRQAAELKERHEGQQTELHRLTQRLNSAGASTNKLDTAMRKIKAQTATYNRELEQQQAALSRVSEQQSRLASITERNRNMRMNATVDAVGVAAAVYGVKKLVNAYGEISSAQGEISSLGISAAGVENITRAAKEFSNQWSGTTQAEFIKASYDIKSGISSLSDAAVGEFTRIAAMTAGATKSSVDQMTSLFASGYGIYRQQFDQFGASTIEGWSALSQAEQDARFGEYFSAGIASAVQAFKTDGSQMSAAISRLGATATAANVSFAEQLSILGSLQATMSGGEAATKYRAFLTNAAKAGDVLNLSFLDAENNLKSMPDILEALRGKYGDTIDAIEEQELKKAFGTDEAIAMLKLLYPEVDALKSSMATMDQSLRGGMATTDEMARKILEGPNESLDRLSNRVKNMAASIGMVFAPAIMFAADRIGDGAMMIASFSEQFPILSNVIAFAVLGLVGLKAASVAARFSFSYLSDAFVLARKMLLFFSATSVKANAVLAVTKVRAMASAAAVLYMSGIQKAAAAKMAIMTAAQWALNAAMTANPVGLVIAAIAGLIAMAAWLIDDWSPVGEFFSGLWDGIKNAFFFSWEMIKVAFSFSPLGMLIEHWEPIVEFFSGLWDRVASIFSSAFAWMKSAVIAPIQSIKDTLGGAWNALFGDADADVNVNRDVRHTVDGGGVNVVKTEPIAAASSVVSSAAQTTQYGDIVISTHEGMSAQDVARAVSDELNQRERRQATRMRSRLTD